MKTIKRIIAIVLVVIICVNNVPIYLRAENNALSEVIEEGICGVELSWKIDMNNTLVILGKGEMDDFTQGNQPWVNYLDTVQKIIIEDEVTSIGKYAFSDCKELKAVIIGEKVTVINNYAFANCAALKEIKFKGDYIDFTEDSMCFEGVNANALYLINNETWKEKQLYNCGGDITWQTFCEHEYSVKECKPTCSEKGYTLHTCVVCGDVYKTDEIEKLEHDYLYLSCNDGTHEITCKNCDYNLIVSCEDINDDKNCDFCDEKMILGSGECGENLTWVLYADNNLIITGTGEMNDYSYENPAPWYTFNDIIEHVQISKEVTKIGSYAFYECVKLTDVNIPEAILEIGEYAFYGCDSFKDDIVIPDKIKTIGLQAFSYCINLESIVLGSDLKNICCEYDSIFEGCSSLETIIFKSKNPPYINYDESEIQDEGCVESLFSKYNVENLKQLIVPEGEYTAYSSAYGNYIPETVRIRECGNKEYIINEDIFVAYLGDEAEFTIPVGVKKIGENAFLNNATIQTVIIPEGVTTIDHKAFKGCTGLTECILPDSVVTIGKSIFYNCNKLEKVIFNAVTMSIPEYMFYNCSSLKNVNMENVTGAIKKYAFYNCKSLDDFVIGDELTSIETYAFGGAKINTLSIKANINNLSSNAFYNTEINYLFLGENVSSINGTITNIKSIKNIDVDEKNLFFSSKEGVLFDKSGNILQRYPGKKDGDAYIIPDNVQVIANNAFKDNKSIISITIPTRTTSIGTDAFSKCENLEKVFYKGTETQWRLVNINTGNPILIGAVIYYNDQKEIGKNEAGWSGTVAQEFGGGTGKSDNPYLISNAEHLAYLAYKVNSGTEYGSTYFKMTNDIVMNNTRDWEKWSTSYAPKNYWNQTIGYYDSENSKYHSFRGVFDGNNYAIIGLYTTKGGLFDKGRYCTIKNLGIEQSFIYGNQSYTGAIMRDDYAGCKIINCYNAGNVKGSNYTGGIAGSCDYIENCYNAGNVKGSSYTGGVVGNNWDGQIISCINTGNVTGSSYVGGIMGKCNTSTGGSLTISRCINNGEIKGSSSVGGIAGYANESDYQLTLEYCENYGTVEATGSYIGGIIGYGRANGTYTPKGFYVKQCANKGNINGVSYVGGIIGRGDSYLVDISVLNCYNVNKIQGTQYVGGVLGANVTSGYDGLSIQNAYNIGTVVGEKNVGGILASKTDAYASNCYYLDTCGGTIEGGKALTEAQMLLEENYKGFDFNGIWAMDSNWGRPVLINTNLPMIPGTNEHLGEWDNSVDEYIIEEVKKYTSSDTYAQFDNIMSSNLSNEEYLHRLNELFMNYGITDVKEGISYLSETTSYRYAYRYMTTNEIYTAFDYWKWLNENTHARAALYSSGLIFNLEALAYIDPTTYSESDYPGVKKNKTFLKNFLEINNDNSVSDVFDISNQSAEFLDNIIKLNDIKVEAELEEVMDRVINASTQKEKEKWQKEFAEIIIHGIETDGSDKIYLDGSKFGEALGYAADIIEFVGATAEDIVDIINMNENIALYQKYSRFLCTIYQNGDVSFEMRMAASSLLDDINNGYWNKTREILNNIFKFEMTIMQSKLVLDKKIIDIALEKAGAGSMGELIGNTVGTLLLGVFISNIVVDVGDFVKQVAYTQGYAELSTLYGLKLEEDKKIFLTNPTAENAWRFFEDYTILWNLRYQGEQQYLNMNSIKMYLFANVKTYNYVEKQEVVQDNLNKLLECRFEVSSKYTIPASVQYMKKAVVNCPVDVYIYKDSGELITVLKDQVESDITNEYGRFAVVKQSYTGEYSKVICLSTEEHLNYELVAVNGGLVDYETYDGNELLTFDKVLVEEGDMINVSDEEYSIDNSFDGNIDKTESLIKKDNDSYIPVESIELNEEEITLNYAENIVIKPTLLPMNATNTVIHWYSMDENIVKVQNGLVQAIDSGETIVRAIAVGGNNIEAEIKVKVLEDESAKADELKFAGASLELKDDLSIRYMVNSALFAEGAYTNPYIMVELNGVETKITDYTVDGDYYVFRFDNIAPHQMNDKAYATIYATYGGKEYASVTRDYSVATYCYSMLEKCKADTYAEFRTLLVDLLGYGAKAQLFVGYKTDELVDANLTETQRAWGTQTDRELVSVLDPKYETVDNPAATWRGAGLNLQESIKMRFVLAADSIDGLSVKVTCDGKEWIIPAEEFTLTSDGYEVLFDGLNAAQLSEEVYVTVYKDGAAVSNTARYSVESYAWAKQSDANIKLAELVKAMMKYGDAVYNYVN